MKRTRKSQLAEERLEFIATGGRLSKPLPHPQPEIDYLLPHLEYEIPIKDDSDGISLKKNAGEVHVMQEVALGTMTQTDKATPGPSSEPPSGVSVENTPLSKRAKTTTKSHLNDLTQARLALIEKDKQMEELHNVRMEEANYKKEAARLVMLQEEAKFKKNS